MIVRALLLATATAFLVSCAGDPYDNEIAPAASNNTANSRDVPDEVIQALPQRLMRGSLPPGTNPVEYLTQLGLGPWIDNLSHEEKYDSFFLYLNRRHMLQIRCDPDSLVITDTEAQAIQNGHVLSSSPLWLKDPVVIGATLREDWYTILVHRIY